MVALGGEAKTLPKEKTKLPWGRVFSTLKKNLDPGTVIIESPTIHTKETIVVPEVKEVKTEVVREIVREVDSSEIERLDKEIGQLKRLGGGSPNRQININSSVMSNAYTDVNFVSNTAIRWSAVDDNTNKRVNLVASLISGGAGSGGTPGGADTQVQFNDDGGFGGNPGLIWNKSASVLSASKVTSSVFVGGRAVITDGSSILGVSETTATEVGYLGGITASVVSISDSQVLTNKTLTSPKVNEAVAVSATATEINILDGATLSTDELNVLDGITASTEELNFTDGVTSAIQTQLDAKQDEDAGLTDIAGLAVTDGNIIVGNGTNWVAESGATARTSLGLGSAAVVNTDLADLNEATIETAIDTLANLTSIQGRTVTLADAGADAILGWDDSANAYENLTQGEVRAVAGLATTDSPQFTAINLGHASDTTLSRSAAGVLAVEGVVVPTISSTNTLTNKTIALGSNTVSGTLAEFNTALTDANFATIAGAETLTSKTLTSPTINSPTINSPGVTGILNVQEGAVRTFTIINAAAVVNANGGIAFALSFQPTFDNNVTVLGVGAWINPTTHNTTYTMSTMQGLRITPTKGANDTVTTAQGIYIGDINFAATSNYAIYTESGRVRLGDVIETAAGQESTGSGSAALGTNSPAVTNSAPYTWIEFRTSDGSTVYSPVWK